MADVLKQTEGAVEGEVKKVEGEAVGLWGKIPTWAKYVATLVTGYALHCVTKLVFGF